MSNLVYPTGFLGLKFPVVRRTKWHTLTGDAMSGALSTQALRAYALYEWEMEYEWLDDSKSPSDLKRLQGFFNKHGGQFDSFLFQDPIFNTVVDEPMGTGDATALAFPTIATYHNAGGPGRADLIQNFNGLPTYKVNGVLTSHTLGPTGIVTFLTPPAASAAITWSGSFYFRCRFKNPSLAFSEFSDHWWETQDPIVLMSVML